ncbi:UDP-N-acetylglucosamine 4,6-dehydratase [Spirochaeta lutea]|uniref:UDP-N-acetylglucosamine 4,6-dehydratase n=1 Tax=Spirochaeta lutea TaxID=1480694 RepID=A0A098QU64_9SPIO|nr:UDP-N-acetylglucosamine 4,6-dehydratase [Spirochaeta lutea]KGE71141.1 UDP-N-acetylglucosamine 4,6-dehydratase [Spirochaeta lutea]
MNNPDLQMIGRTNELLAKDVESWESELSKKVEQSSFLVIGGAGSIGQAVTKEIFKRNPKKLHVVDLSENNLVELVRDIRSSFGYISGDFSTFAIDCGSVEFEAYITAQPTFDYVLNLSALKHVRSERDPYTLMRMVQVNILNTIKTIELAIKTGAKKYFCVSTDKAANPVNMMGASKRIMEQYLFSYADKITISTARFANVAFSDGSLLQGFTKRIEKNQPISAPNDVRRYFVTFEEAGQLCLMSTILGESKEIFFPKLSEELNLITFSEIAKNFLKSRGYQAVECASEDEARSSVATLKQDGRWPCYFSKSDTTGEKDFEEFFTPGEEVDLDRFSTLGVVLNSHGADQSLLRDFTQTIHSLLKRGSWEKTELVALFKTLLPNFGHKETGKYLDGKM